MSSANRQVKRAALRVIYSDKICNHYDFTTFNEQPVTTHCLERNSLKNQNEEISAPGKTLH